MLVLAAGLGRGEEEYSGERRTVPRSFIEVQLTVLLLWEALVVPLPALPSLHALYLLITLAPLLLLWGLRSDRSVAGEKRLEGVTKSAASASSVNMRSARFIVTNATPFFCIFSSYVLGSVSEGAYCPKSTTLYL